MNPKVDAYLKRAKQWQEEMIKLRAIALECGLNEDFKWGHPCYTLDDSNIVLIHGFKEYCAFLFFKGVLLKDPKNILIQQTKNVQSARQIRFTNVKEIVKLKSALKSYIKNAIEVEKSDLKVTHKKTSEFKIPSEFKAKLDKSHALKTAFKALTPGRQRAYILHFAQAKQSSTREARIAKYTPQILKGKGLND